jgi:hypothetical protein
MRIRPAAFGAATFRYSNNNGEPHFDDIECLGGEILGEQTVPRVETWGSIVLLTRVSANVIACLGIDASYIARGVHNRNTLCRGKHVDLWSVLFAVFEYRTAEFEYAKVTSHLEDVGILTVEEKNGIICDIVGNALADEAAELTSKLLRPLPAKCKQVSAQYTEAFLVCIRIGLTQARAWDMAEGALIYKTPEAFEASATNTEIELIKATQNLANNGHVPEATTWGNLRGHRCLRCDQRTALHSKSLGPHSQGVV